MRCVLYKYIYHLFIILIERKVSYSSIRESHLIEENLSARAGRTDWWPLFSSMRVFIELVTLWWSWLTDSPCWGRRGLPTWVVSSTGKPP